jgi:hypothetical protein
MQFPHLIAQVIGRSVDPILTAYLVAAGAPILVAILVWAWMAFLAYEKQRRDARRRPGICRHCGYDLRATPGGEALFTRCPECGRAVGEEQRATP